MTNFELYKLKKELLSQYNKKLSRYKSLALTYANRYSHQKEICYKLDAEIKKLKKELYGNEQTSK